MAPGLGVRKHSWQAADGQQAPTIGGGAIGGGALSGHDAHRSRKKSKDSKMSWRPPPFLPSLTRLS